MTYLIIGNILSFISVVFLALSTQKNDKHQIMLYQVFDCLFTALANIVLGGYSGAVVTLIGVLRNLLSYYDKMTRSAAIWLSVLMVVIGIAVNTHGIFGFLPIIASVQYTLYLGFCFKKASGVKLALAFNLAIWVIYNLAILAIPGFITDAVIFVLSVIGYFRSLKSEK